MATGSCSLLHVDSAKTPHFFVDGDGRAVYLVGTGVQGTFQPGTFGTPDYAAYLDSMVTYGHNLQRMRIWENGWIRGSDMDFRPTIYERTGPGQATDGGPKFDLERLDEAFFTELRSRVTASRDRGIYVMLMFFHGYSAWNDGRDFWGGHPYHGENNVNGIDGDPDGVGQGIKIHTLDIPQITRLQERYVGKILDTLGDLDNVLYEIGNELKSGPEFQNHFVEFVKRHEAGKPGRHPVGVSAYAKAKVEFDWEPTSTMISGPADWIAPGGLSHTEPGVEDRKILFFDSDHSGAWGLPSTMAQWPWKSFLRGQNPIFMDVPEDASRYGRDAGLVETVRKRLGQTSVYAGRTNLAAMRPRNDLASTAYCLADPGSEYLVYQPDGGAFDVDLAAGTYAVEWFDVAAGSAAAGSSVKAAAGPTSFVPPSTGEAVLYLKADGTR